MWSATVTFLISKEISNRKSVFGHGSGICVTGPGGCSTARCSRALRSWSPWKRRWDIVLAGWSTGLRALCAQEISATTFQQQTLCFLLTPA